MTKIEIESKIEKLQKAINSKATDKRFIPKLKAEKEKFEGELAKLGSNKPAISRPASSKKSSAKVSKAKSILNKYKYLSNRLVDSVVVNNKGKKTSIDSKDILDGVYVKKEVEYADGGMMAKGGTTNENLIKELNKLQRELNSRRLQTYMEGDTSEQEMARQKERTSKLARFNEILRLLNENEKKMADGGNTDLSRDRMFKSQQKWEQDYQRKTRPKNPQYRKFEDGGGLADNEIGFIPMDLEDKFALLSKWGGINIKELIGILNAMIDSGVTDSDLLVSPTKNTSFQRERAIEKKINEIWEKIQPQYKGDLKGYRYYSTLKELISRNWIYENLLHQFKPFRKFQKFEDGGGIDLLSDSSGAELYNIGGTSFSNVDLTPQMDITNPMFADGGQTDSFYSKLVEEHTKGGYEKFGVSFDSFLNSKMESAIAKGDMKTYHKLIDVKEMYEDDFYAKGGKIKVGDKVRSTIPNYEIEGEVLSKQKDYYFVRQHNALPNGDFQHHVLRIDEVEKMAHGGSVPENFGKGKNINVFGYETKFFNNCPKAVEEFENSIQHANTDEEKENLSKLAEHIDKIFEIEHEVVHGIASSSTSFDEAIKETITASYWNYRSGMAIDLFSFIPQHLKQIATRLNNTNFEDGGVLNLLSDTSGAGLQNVGGSSFSNVDLTPQMDITNPMFAEGGNVGKKNAKLILIDSENPLLKQMNKLTGDSFSDIDFDDKNIGNFNILTHKKSGDIFIVYPKRVYNQLPKEAIKDDINYLKNVQKIVVQNNQMANGGETDDEFDSYQSVFKKWLSSDLEVEFFSKSASNDQPIEMVQRRQKISQQAMQNKKELDELIKKLQKKGYDTSKMWRDLYNKNKLGESSIYKMKLADGGQTNENYKIFEGYDSFKNNPIYSVHGVDNDYFGEWHTSKEDAEQELKGLRNKNYAKGGGVNNIRSFDFNEEGNLATTINGKYYEIIYRDDKSQMYDLFEDGKKIKSSRAVRDVMIFADGGLTEHGLQIGDKIIDKTNFNKNGISVMNDGRYAMVDLDKGERIEGIYANGGGIKGLYEGNIRRINGKDYLFSDSVLDKNGDIVGWNAYEVVYDNKMGEKNINYERTKKQQFKYFKNNITLLGKDVGHEYFADGGSLKDKFQIVNSKGYFSRSMKTGKPIFINNFELGYTYAKDDAQKMVEFLKKETNDSDLKVVPFASEKFNDEYAKGGEIYKFNAYLYNDDEDRTIKEKKEYKVKATSRNSAYQKAYKKYPKPYFVELYSVDSYADGGSVNKYFLRWDSINSRGGVNRNNKELSELPNNIVVNQSNYVFIKKDTINGKDYVPVRIIGGFKGVQLSEQEIKDKKIKRIETMEFADGGYMEKEKNWFVIKNDDGTFSAYNSEIKQSEKEYDMTFKTELEAKNYIKKTYPKSMMAKGGTTSTSEFPIVTIFMDANGQDGLEELYDYLEQEQGIIVDNSKNYKKDKGTAQESYTNDDYLMLKFNKSDLKNVKKFEKKFDDLYFPEYEITYRYSQKMAKGGTTTFNDKVKSISQSLLKRKKVSPSVQKDYGKTYDKKEAVESAKRIVGAIRKKAMAKGSKLKVNGDDFSFLLKLSDKELSKRLDLVQKQQVINSKQYFSARDKKQSTTKIEESRIRLDKQERAIIEARIKGMDKKKS